MMKYIIIILFIAIAITLGLGIYLNQTEVDVKLGGILIGSSLGTGIFVWMPLFLFYRSKGRKLKDYMLTPENIKKMQGKNVD